ncbi:hypothetical protein [Actinoplanes sp. NPDC049316]|uniref:hypothetical protein n=1 Tax=Actinoplanes sp. NPDC049316 TaxID=3154727 RepID=UPI00342CE93D
MKDFFADAGAAAIHRVELPEATGTLASRLAAAEQLLADPSEALVRKVDELDHDGRGLVYAGSYTAVRSFCGRRVLGSRLESHFAAERKDVQYRLLGLATSDRRLLRIEDHTDIREAIIAQVMHGPTVIQGVPRGLLAIGASHTYLLPEDASAVRIGQLLASIAEDCADLIVGPLHAGLPCTYYGFLTSDHVVDFGPFEALVYWDRRSWRLYAPGVIRPVRLGGQEAACRSAVRAATRQVQQRIDYTGAFGTDGAVSATAYSVHEINPRICAGFALLDSICQDFIPLAAVDLVVRERQPTKSHPLMVQLEQLATALRRIQTPLIRLWDGRHSSIQETLTESALRASDPAAWLSIARSCLADKNFVSITQFNPAGGY